MRKFIHNVIRIRPIWASTIAYILIYINIDNKACIILFYVSYTLVLITENKMYATSEAGHSVKM